MFKHEDMFLLPCKLSKKVYGELLRVKCIIIKLMFIVYGIKAITLKMIGLSDLISGFL